MGAEQYDISNTNHNEEDLEVIREFFEVQMLVIHRYYSSFKGRQRPGPGAIWLMEQVHQFGELATTRQIIGHTRSEETVLQSTDDLRGLIYSWRFVLNNSHYLITEY